MREAMTKKALMKETFHNVHLKKGKQSPQKRYTLEKRKENGKHQSKCKEIPYKNINCI